MVIEENMIFRVLLIFTLIIGFASCAKQVDQKNKGRSKFKIRLPKSDKSKVKRSIQSVVTGMYTENNITDPDLNDVDCYAVFVSWNNNLGICKDADGADIATADQVIGSESDGGVLEADVESGSGRVFRLLAFRWVGGSCPDLAVLDYQDYQNMSAPAIIGEATADLVAGETVTIDITASVDGDTKFINTCRDGPFTWELPGLFDDPASKWDSAKWGP